MAGLDGKRIVLGVTGSIAAYKSVEVARLLLQDGADVHVIMTREATAFIGPMTFSAITGHEAFIEQFPEAGRSGEAHIDLSVWADVMAVVPATANMIGKIALGLADDLLSTTLMSCESPCCLAPAMNFRMLANPAVQANMETLRNRGFHVIEPVVGLLANGEFGEGRMESPDRITQVIAMLADSRKDMKGRRVMISAGPTVEALDPVRYITNRSSGKMGFALAQMAARRGADVTLITGPSILADPYGVRVIRIRSAEEMRQAALSHLIGQDAVIMAAAVADYRPKTAATQKIKKGEDTLTLEMERTADILTEIGKKRPPVLVGFAVETNDGLRYAREKLVRKNLDMVVYNDITQEGAGFDVDTNIVTLLHRDGREQEIPIQSKKDVADRILDEVALLFETRKTTPEHV